MNSITHRTEDKTETVTKETDDEMADQYGFSNEQIVSVAHGEVGNVGGEKYWRWYGFNSKVEWCAYFVSWCANQCGYIDAGIIPKFAPFAQMVQTGLKPEING